MLVVRLKSIIDVTIWTLAFVLICTGALVFLDILAIQDIPTKITDV